MKNRSLLRLDGKTPNRLISLHDLQLDYLVAKAKSQKIMSYLHNQLLEAYRKECGNKWSSGPEDGYFYKHIAYHMKEAEKREELRNLLLDFEWMCAKLNKVFIIQKEIGVKKLDVNSLLRDYDYLPGDKEIRLIQGAIKLSFNAITKDSTQLAGQLLGRLLCFRENGIQALLSQACECKDSIRLLPITSSLRLPGGRLIRTLEGHDDRMTAIAITPDGKYAVSASFDKTLKLWDLEQGIIVSNFTGDNFFLTCDIAPDWESIVASDTLGKMHFLHFEKPG